MQKIKFYFEGHSLGYECAISDWYCKPSILRCLALKAGALFITCSKYGRRQFVPDFSVSFPVYMFYFRSFKNGLPWLTIEFDNDSTPAPSNSKCFLPSFIDYL